MEGFWMTAARYVVAHPWATILLLVAGSLLLFHDLLTPLTWGATGTLGVVCLGTVFAANLSAHTGGWVGVVLLLLGLTLLLVETHLLPGQGVAAVFGLIFLFAGMFVALGGNKNAAFALTVSSVLTLVSLTAFFTYLPKSPLWKQLGREMRQRSEPGWASAPKLHLLGREGVTLTALRPLGAAEIDGVQVEVVTEGEFLEQGTRIIVARIDGNRIVVDDAHLSAIEFALKKAPPRWVRIRASGSRRDSQTTAASGRTNS